MTGLPHWAAQKIADTTGLDPRLGRRARADTCPRCHAHVLTGLDEDKAAFTATTDPRRLTPLGELLALVAGRATYYLDGQPPALTIRDRHRIRGHPADTTTVLAEHQCDAPLLPAYSDPPPPPREETHAIPF